MTIEAGLESPRGEALSQNLQRVDNLILRLVTESAPESLRKIIQEHFRSGGKRLRPYIVIELAEAYSLNIESVLGWAAACEILHNATLIHDDIQDGDVYRRGKPTAWSVHGLNPAMNAGDLLLILGPMAIARLPYPAPVKWELSQRLCQMAAQIVRGQAIETSLIEKPPHELKAAYLECIEAKTAPLFSDAAQGVATLAHLNAYTADQIKSIFDSLGVLFQIQDDILDLFGEKGRELSGCDIKEGKVSFLVANHIEKCPQDWPWLKTLLNQEREDTLVQDIQVFREKIIASDTLLNAAEFIQESTQEIMRTPCLESNKKLKKIVYHLLAKILDPISHVDEMKKIMEFSL